MTKQITTQFKGACAACGREIKSGKRALFNAETRKLYHEHRDYGDCPDRANEVTAAARTGSLRDPLHREYYTSGQFDRDEEDAI